MIKKTVREILEEVDVASQKLELNLSDPKCKAYVRHVVNSFLEEQKAKPEEEEAEAVADDDDNNNNKEFDNDEFRGKNLISIREYYKKDGKELPSSKRISLTEKQWSALKKNLPNIEKAVRKMESLTM